MSGISSRAQPGPHGLISNFLAGKSLAGSTGEAFEALRAGLSAISPVIGAALDKDATASLAWEQQPWSLGSYASAKPGQYATLLPRWRKRLNAAGSCTSQVSTPEPDYLGFMNGAVLSGNRAAMELLTQSVP